jgi:hypothetical protein
MAKHGVGEIWECTVMCIGCVRGEVDQLGGGCRARFLGRRLQRSDLIGRRVLNSKMLVHLDGWIFYWESV